MSDSENLRFSICLRQMRTDVGIGPYISYICFNTDTMGGPTLPNVINQLKGYVSKRMGFSVWQKLYYDHIIRDQKDYDEKWQYIDDNPRTWCEKNGFEVIEDYGGSVIMEKNL